MFSVHKTALKVLAFENMYYCNNKRPLCMPLCVTVRITFNTHYCFLLMHKLSPNLTPITCNVWSHYMAAKIIPHATVENVPTLECTCTCTCTCLLGTILQGSEGTVLIGKKYTLHSTVKCSRNGGPIMCTLHGTSHCVHPQDITCSLHYRKVCSPPKPRKE